MKSAKSIQKKAPARIKEIHHHSSNYSSKIVNITKRVYFPIFLALGGSQTDKGIFFWQPPRPRAFQLRVTLHKVGATELVAKVACLCIAEETRIPRDSWSSRVFPNIWRAFPQIIILFLPSGTGEFLYHFMGIIGF